ncbi:unnamed protein product [Triticum turgidum subsp. durum]|uniref:Bidirectional sugar transporter SWEET n=1 Tax=Triticum turgidum subsp. durum TaxID=4567 RepID=A0A9R0WQX1_TRITD|nr:unnamed protein product [Triticum turgidum subsp. durum]
MAEGLFSMAHPWASAFGILGNIISFLVFHVPAGVPEEVDGGVQRGAVRGGALQLHAVDLLRAGQDQLQPAADHQRLRLRRRVLLHPALRGVRAQERQAPRPRLLPPPRRRRLLPHRRRHRLPRAPAQPRQGPRQRLPRLLHGRLRRPPQRHLRGDQDQERRVHALLALLLPHPQRRRLVLLRPLHQGHLRHRLPNVGGFFFGVAQMTLYFCYRKPDTSALVLPTGIHDVSTEAAAQQEVELPEGTHPAVAMLTVSTLPMLAELQKMEQEISSPTPRKGYIKAF